MKVVANKQNAARPGVEQLADSAKVFVIFKQQIKTHTVTDINPSRHSMKMRATRADQCTDEMFDKLTLPKLSDFIWAHDPNVLMKKDIQSNKGKLEDAKYHCKPKTTVVLPYTRV